MAKIVKFIVTRDGQVVFGNSDFSHDYHDQIAMKNNVREGDVKGGGLADLEKHRIFGTSYGFGPYNPARVAQLLPDWQVEAPSPY